MTIADIFEMWLMGRGVAYHRVFSTFLICIDSKIPGQVSVNDNSIDVLDVNRRVGNNGLCVRTSYELNLCDPDFDPELVFKTIINYFKL